MLTPLFASGLVVLLDEAAPSTIRAGRVHVERGFAPPRLVQDLRHDIDCLTTAGLFERAFSGGTSSGDEAFRNAEMCDPVGRDRSVGLWDAFYAVWERLDLVRQELSAALGREMSTEMELHYVRYPVGGYYRRHVDEDLDANPRALTRAISFICYLNDPGWCAADGGELRSYPPGEPPSDVLPESGTLVVFDSARVEHEVQPTGKERLALVGWFHAPAADPGQADVFDEPASLPAAAEDPLWEMSQS